ncbi:MAG: hypothetical protein WA964_15970 [Ilumatobacter sp.]|uniref:hypothetical protein n=1 Tax=Ilumatobacter sp. TaxID=1967498 RepID=UPI003C7504F0
MHVDRQHPAGAGSDEDIATANRADERDLDRRALLHLHQRRTDVDPAAHRCTTNDGCPNDDHAIDHAAFIDHQHHHDEHDDDNSAGTTGCVRSRLRREGRE